MDSKDDSSHNYNYHDGRGGYNDRTPRNAYDRGIDEPMTISPGGRRDTYRRNMQHEHQTPLASAGVAMMASNSGGPHRNTEVYKRRNEEMLQRQRTDGSYVTPAGETYGRSERPMRGDRGPRIDRHGA